MFYYILNSMLFKQVNQDNNSLHKIYEIYWFHLEICGPRLTTSGPKLTSLITTYNCNYFPV